MLDETRHILNKATDELIESFIGFDKKKANHLRVGLDAIYHAQKNAAPDTRVNIYAVCDYEILHNLLEKHGISRREFAKVPHILEKKDNKQNKLAHLSKPLREALLNIENNSRPNYELPTPTMVALMFNMVQHGVTHALIAGQAGERTLKAMERATAASSIPMLKANALHDTLYDFGDGKRLARRYIGNSGKEPEYLVFAKATNHLADLFESSLQMHPSARTTEGTEKSMQGFRKLAAKIFHHAADNLQIASAPEAADKIKKLAYHVDKESPGKDSQTAFNYIEKGMQTIMEAMHADGVINSEESNDYKELVGMRIEQMRKMELA